MLPAHNPEPPQTSLNKHVHSVLERCSRLSHLKQLQAYLLTLGHGQTPFYAFKLVRFAALAIADLPYSRRIFDSLAAPNVYLYAALIAAYTSRPDPASALDLFALMLRRGHSPPNQFIYPHVLKSCTDASDLSFTKSTHTHVLKTGFSSYSVVQTSLLDAYSRFSDLSTARLLFDELPDRNVVSWTAMVSGYARVGRIGNAIALFEEMPEKNVPAWNAVISGCTQNGFFSEAVPLFHRMLLAGARPNQTTLVCVLSACGHLGMLRLGKWVHGYVIKNHMSDSHFISNAIIDMYGKCGNLKEARWIFSTQSDRSLTAWNSIINCLALHGHSETAITTFREMELNGPKPDRITFVGLLNACTHGGLVDEGLGYFDSMSRDHWIEPQIEHYGCVIDLLGRAGRFEDALGMVRDMQFEPDEVVWGSLLNGCRIHKHTGLAELALRKLLELDPNNAGYGVMLANLYSECGKWEEVRKVRRILKEDGGKKLPGCSWIEVDNEVCQFYSGDKLHPEAEEICKVLDELVGLMEA